MSSRQKVTMTARGLHASGAKEEALKWYFELLPDLTRDAAPE